MKKRTLEKQMNRIFILIFSSILVAAMILMSLVMGNLYWNQYYQMCTQLVSANMELLDTQVMQIERTQEIIATNASVKEAVQYYAEQTEHDYSRELFYYRSMEDIFHVFDENPEVKSAYIIDKNGEYLFFYKQSLKKNYNMLEQEWYQSLVQTIQISNGYVSDIHERKYLVNDNDDICCSLVMPIQSRQKVNFSADAYLVCDIDLDGILGSGDEDNMRFALMDTSDELYSPRELSKEMQMEIEKQRAGATEDHSIWRQPLIGGTDPLVVSIKSHFFGWKIIGIMELTELKRLITVLLFIAFGVILVAVLMVSIASRIVSKSILTPLNRLVVRCNRVAEGDYQSPFEDGKSVEINFLSANIQSMVENIVSLSHQLVEEEKKLSEERLRTLQHQINPHFLNNVLQTIKALSVSGETEKISRITIYLGRILAYSVYQPYENVALDVELEYVKNYIEVQNIRYDNKILYSIDCEEKAREIQIPKLTLQPLVENAIEHGYDGKSRLVIDISAECEPDMICILIRDNGVGISEHELQKLQEQMESEVYHRASGVGIVNVNERLKRKFGEKSGIEIKAGMKGGMTVIIHIPKQEKD